jgi:asparagine synthase (glutamine-hydrolysing)
MCGILCICGTANLIEARKRALILRKKIQHRGMDESGIVELGDSIFCHERLSIVNPESGSQPIISDCGNVTVCVNGEIYNYKELKNELTGTYMFKSDSDCEVIPYLYKENGIDFLQTLNGDFAFVLYDATSNTIFAARDPHGVCPLYYGYGKDGSVWFCSEMKGLVEDCTTYFTFPPGHFYDSSLENPLVKWYNPVWHDLSYLPNETACRLNNSLTRAVEKRLMADVPFGVCLSGGLDSSLIASIAKRLITSRGSDTPLPSFCIGLKGSPDLAASRKVADFLGTNHHEFHFTVQDGIDALRDVIYHTETYDITTVRASTPMYILARHIRSLGYKMILSGEGADEIFGGYLYFHKAPNREEFHKETVRKLQNLHLYDCLRANKSMMAWGVETRVPFLDTSFLEIAMGLDPELKRPRAGIEKYILRDAFTVEDSHSPYLPDDILWRQKEQFSDGVGYGWIDGLKDYAEKEVCDNSIKNAGNIFLHNTPTSKEGYLYRTIFSELFPGGMSSATVPGGPTIACSTAAAVEWDESFKGRLDPSGRSIGDIHHVL